MSNESFFDKVKDFITGHPEQADQGLDKAEEMLDERTGGQYTEQIAQGDDVVRERLGLPDDEGHRAGARRPAGGAGRPDAHARNGPGAADRADAHRADAHGADARPSRRRHRRPPAGPGPHDAARDGPRGRAGHDLLTAAGPARVAPPALRETTDASRLAPVDGQASLISASTAPLVTVAPISAVSPVTRRRPCGR